VFKKEPNLDKAYIQKLCSKGGLGQKRYISKLQLFINKNLMYIHVKNSEHIYSFETFEKSSK
jgi:hypothetical protein